MKTKIMLLTALLGVAAMSASAGVRFDISIGLPLPVVVSTPVVCAPAPVTVVQTVPACPDVNYVWAPGYWSYYRPTGWVWISGGWHPRPVYFGRGYDRDRDHDRGGYRR
jgi:hypothetical protein